VIGTSAALFNYFRCIQYDTVNVMALDYGIECDSTRYKAYIAYTVFMILIYPVGVPLSYAILLWQHRNTLCNPIEMQMEKANGFPETRDVLFLVNAYKEEFYYFEVIECFRRIFLGSIVGVLGGTQSVAPATVGLIVSMGCIGLFARMEPYKHQSDNNVSAVLAYALSLYFLAALMLKTEAMASTDTSPAVLLFLVFGSGPVSIAFEWFREFGNMWKLGGEVDTNHIELMKLPTVTAMVMQGSFKKGSSSTSLDDVPVMAEAPKKAPLPEVVAPPQKTSIAPPKLMPTPVVPQEADIIVTIPPNARAGMVLKVQAGPSGQIVQIMVPPGAPPGARIKVRVPIGSTF
jgi:hypothetical protein